MRTLVDIPDDALAALDAMRARRGVSRAGLIRAAIGDFLARHTPGESDTAFGLWRDLAEDGLAYQRRLRDEW